jgi:hypothetical protein
MCMIGLWHQGPGASQSLKVASSTQRSGTAIGSGPGWLRVGLLVILALLIRGLLIGCHSLVARWLSSVEVEVDGQVKLFRTYGIKLGARANAGEGESASLHCVISRAALEVREEDYLNLTNHASTSHVDLR